MCQDSCRSDDTLDKAITIAREPTIYQIETLSDAKVTKTKPEKNILKANNNSFVQSFRNLALLTKSLNSGSFISS